MEFQFKKLELESDKRWYQKIINSANFKKSALFILLGAVGGVLYYYVGTKNFDFFDMLKSAGIGAFLGFFISNSPCARGKC